MGPLGKEAILKVKNKVLKLKSPWIVYNDEGLNTEGMMFPMLHLEARRDLSDLGLLFDRQGRPDQRGGHSSRSLAGGLGQDLRSSLQFLKVLGCGRKRSFAYVVRRLG